MESNKLNLFEIEDIEDCLPMFEEVFKIKLKNEETERVKSFDEFCDLIISKYNFENNSLCTSQRAFYQFRKALEVENITKSTNISPKTDLKNVLPRRNRIKNIRKVEKQLGYKLEVLQASQITINVLFYMLIISLIGLFFVWKIAVYGILVSVLGFYLIKFTNRIDKKTVRELMEKNTAQNYFKIRNSENSINKSEFKAVILEWFSENAGIEKEKLKYGNFY